MSFTSFTGSVAGPLTCVLAISSGQVLFKIASGLIDLRNPLAEPKGLACWSEVQRRIGDAQAVELCA